MVNKEAAKRSSFIFCFEFICSLLLPGLCGVSVSLLLSMFNYVFFGLFLNLLFMDGLASVLLRVCLFLIVCTCVSFLQVCLIPPILPLFLVMVSLV